MIGVLYTVLLAFMVVVVWDQLSGARETADGEVTRLSNLLRDAETFPAPARMRIRRSIVSYAGTVVDKEWRTMEQGEASPAAQEAYGRIWKAYYALKPESEQASIFYGESLTRLNELGQYRRLRLLAARESFPTVLWIFLIAGAVVTIGYAYMLGSQEPLVNALAVAGLAGLSALALFLVFAMNHPFSGTVKVTPEAFSALYGQWSHIGGVAPCDLCADR